MIIFIELFRTWRKFEELLNIFVLEKFARTRSVEELIRSPAKQEKKGLKDSYSPEKKKDHLSETFFPFLPGSFTQLPVWPVNSEVSIVSKVNYLKYNGS